MSQLHELSKDELNKVVVLLVDKISEGLEEAKAQGIHVAGSGHNYDLYQEVERLIRGHAANKKPHVWDFT